MLRLKTDHWKLVLVSGFIFSTTHAPVSAQEALEPAAVIQVEDLCAWVNVQSFGDAIPLARSVRANVRTLLPLRERPANCNADITGSFYIVVIESGSADRSTVLQLVDLELCGNALVRLSTFGAGPLMSYHTNLRQADAATSALESVTRFREELENTTGYAPCQQPER